MSTDVDPDAARRAVAANPAWYHAIELAPGVVTPGRADWRHAAAKLLPEALSGKRALDVGTFDGFWAFELERRGADVVAIDVESLDAAEWPALSRPRLEATAREWDLELGRGFALAAEALHSSVRRDVCPVYELSADRIGGPVDFAFVGALLLHLRDPVRALERVAATLRPGAEVVLLEPISLRDTLRSPRRPVARFQAASSDFNWWVPNLSALKAMAWAAGLVEVRGRGLHRPRGELRGVYAALSARAPEQQQQR
jgi:SAM-dependent methyltransferase